VDSLDLWTFERRSYVYGILIIQETKNIQTNSKSLAAGSTTAVLNHKASHSLRRSHKLRLPLGTSLKDLNGRTD
jgi:hypothetical protein